MDYFYEIVKVKNKIEDFLIFHEQDVIYRASAASHLFVIWLENKHALNFLEKIFCKNLPASEVAEINKSLSEINDALLMLKSVDAEVREYFSRIEAGLRKSIDYDFIVDDVCLSRQIILDGVLNEFFNWSIEYGFSFSTSNGVISENNIFNLFVDGCEYIGFEVQWFGKFQSIEGLIKPKLAALKRSSSDVSLRGIPACMRVISEIGRRNGFLM